MTARSIQLAGMLDYAPDKLELVPEHLRKGLRWYIEDGMLPGGALLSVLQSLPVGVVVPRLDEDFLAGLQAVVGFLHNHAPGKCWGSPEAVAAWSAGGGLAGLAQERGWIS